MQSIPPRSAPFRVRRASRKAKQNGNTASTVVCNPTQNRHRNHTCQLWREKVVSCGSCCVSFFYPFSIHTRNAIAPEWMKPVLCVRVCCGFFFGIASGPGKAIGSGRRGHSANECAFIALFRGLFTGFVESRGKKRR